MASHYKPVDTNTRITNLEREQGELRGKVRGLLIWSTMCNIVLGLIAIETMLRAWM